MNRRPGSAFLALAARPARAKLLHDGLERLPGEVQTIETRVAALELGHDAKALRVVIEAAVIVHAGIERAFAGVSERRMAEVMR